MNHSLQILLLCFVMAVTIMITISSFSPLVAVNALTEAEKKNLTDNLKFFEKYINNSIHDAKAQLDTTGTSCTINNYACNPYKEVPKINFTDNGNEEGFIPGHFGYVQPNEAPGQDYSSDTDLQTKACQLDRMGTQWLQNYNDSERTILYQYFTYPNDFAGFYPQSPWNCTSEANYVPTTRPFYTSSSLGQKDVIILMDASDKTSNSAWRLSVQKKIAERIVRSLSFKDYVAVIPFGDAPDEQINLMTQSVEANVDTIVNSVTSIELMSDNGTNIGAAINRAFDVLGTSRDIGLTSACTRVVILLTQGVNDFNVPQPGSGISANRNDIVFPILVNQDPPAGAVTLMNQISCASASLTQNVTEDNTQNVSATIELINKYFTSIQSTTVMRYSEVYEDALGQGQILSLSAPVFKTDSNSNDVFAGVTTVDVPLSGVIKDMTSIAAQEVTDFLLESTVCVPLNQRGSRQAAVVSRLQDGQCAGVAVEKIGFRTTAEGEELAINKAMPGIIVGSVFFILIIFGVGLYLNNANSEESYSYDSAGPLIALIVFLVCWIISIPIMFALVAPDLVETHNFVKTPLTLTSSTGTPFRCCELTSCTHCSYSSASSCATEIPRLTNDASAGSGPFECHNGHYCCRWRTYECNCHRSCSSSSKGGSSCSTSCSTCRECVQSVRRRECSIGCGTCYSMKTKFRYRYPGETGDLYQSQWTKICTLRGAASCRDQWLAEHPVPSRRDGFVNPEDPIDVRREVKVRQPPFIAFMVFACLSIPVLIFAYYLILKEYCKGSSSSSGFNWGSSDTPKKLEDSPVEMAKTFDGPPAHTFNNDHNSNSNSGGGISATNNNNNTYDNNGGYYSGQGVQSGAQTYPPPSNQHHHQHQATYPQAPPPSQPQYDTGDNVAPPPGGYNFDPMGTGQQPMYSSNNSSPAGVPPPSNVGGIQGI